MSVGDLLVSRHVRKLDFISGCVVRLSHRRSHQLIFVGAHSAFDTGLEPVGMLGSLPVSL